MKTNALRAPAVAIVAAVLAACGGKVVLDTSSSASSSGPGGGATTSTTSSGGGACPAPCPMPVPAQGASCACPGEQCVYDACPVDGPMTIATCDAGGWSLDTMSCAPIPCGMAVCMPGEVCLHQMMGDGIFESCIPNPCAPMAAACSCATSVCSLEDCSGGGDNLFCSCGGCP